MHSMEGQLSQQERGSNFLQGLLVALEHPHLSTHPQVLSAAARVCKGWREAVQQCSACNTEVVLCTAAARVKSFAQWLLQHAGFISAITLRQSKLHFVEFDSRAFDGLPSHVTPLQAQELLQQSIGTVSALPVTTDGRPAAAHAEAAAAAAAAWPVAQEGLTAFPLVDEQQQQQQQQQKQGLRLRSFTSNWSSAVDMLAVLHPHSLTRVDLDLCEVITGSAALSEAFRQLSSLQQLRISGMREASHGSALTALGQLRQLTSLELSGRWPTGDSVPGQVWDNHQGLKQPAAIALQLLLMQPLPLQELKLQLGCRLPLLDMARLTQLTQIDASECRLDAETVLPQQLQRLAFQSWGGADSMAPLISARLQLTQLTHLSVRVDFTQQQPLLQLAQLPALQHLALRYGSHMMDYNAALAVPAASATAPAWALLPQLRELSIETGNCYNSHPRDCPTQQQMAAVVAGAAAAASLTQLVLLVGSSVLEGPAACVSLSSLSGLSHLRYLSIGSGPALQLPAGDALALTALTGLTHLHLLLAEHELGVAAATALARELKQLRSLGFIGCGLQLGTAEGRECLQEVGRLTQLTYLSLSHNSGLIQQGLMQLTRLSRLQMLEVKGAGNAVTNDDLDVFWAAVRQR